MDKISGYVIANAQGGYDVVTKTSKNNTPFVIPNIDEDIPKASNTSKADKSRNYDYVDYNPFEAVKTGSVALPEHMSTKTEARRSDEEILKDMEALAKEHAKTGQFQDSDPRFKALMDEYLSSVSPDRESILKNSTNEIQERLLTEIYPALAELEKQIKEKDKENEKEAIDYFIELINKGKNNKDIINANIATRGMAAIEGAYSVKSIERNGDYTTAELDYGGGKTTTLNYDKEGNLVSRQMKGNNYSVGSITGNTVNNAFFYDDNGETIMSYVKDHSGLIQLNTNAENSRQAEILSVYNASYDVTYGRRAEYWVKQGNGVPLYSKAFEGVNDIKEEVYNKTYDRLMSETANSVG